MNRKFSTILAVLLIVALSTSTVGAAGAIKLSGGFNFGSLKFIGTMTGIGGYGEGVSVILEGSGTPVVTCTNKGKNPAPGQNPSKINVSGIQFIGPVSIDENGKASVDVRTQHPTLTGKQGGCPNNNWSAAIDFVFWETADLYVYDGLAANNVLLLEQHYTCVTTRNPDTLSCTLVSETSYH